MTNRKQHSATGNASDGTNSQEQVNALYIAHQVHTLANLIYRRMTTGSAGSGSFGTQGQPAGQPGTTADAAYGAHGHAPSAWSAAGAPGQGATQDMNAAFGAMHGGTMNHTIPFDFASYGAMQAAAGGGYGFHPYFGAHPFGVTPFGAGNAANPAFGFHPYFAMQNAGAPGSPFGYPGGFGAPGFAPAQNPFGFSGFGASNHPYFATQGVGNTQNPFGFTGFGGMNAAPNAACGFDPYFAMHNVAGMNNAFGQVPYGAMYGAGMGNPFGFVPHWMFANPAAMQSPFGFMPHWGTQSGNTMHDPSGYMNAAACTPRNAAFSPAPALFYWYP